MDEPIESQGYQEWFWEQTTSVTVPLGHWSRLYGSRAMTRSQVQPGSQRLIRKKLKCRIGSLGVSMWPTSVPSAGLSWAIVAECFVGRLGMLYR